MKDKNKKNSSLVSEGKDKDEEIEDQGNKADAALRTLFDFSVQTNIGQVRSENQDAYGFIGYDKGFSFIVADGMGGAQGGEVASHMVVSSILADLVNDEGRVTEDTVRSSIETANSIIYSASQAYESLSGMGTTTILLSIEKERVMIANVGDSRIYMLHKGEMIQLTKDHTLVQELIDSGTLDAVKAKNHPIDHILTRALGQTDSVEVDVNILGIDAEVGDKFLLCSDGLTGHVGDSEIRDILISCDSQNATEQLIKLANARGGSDNITVQVLEIKSKDTFPDTINWPKEDLFFTRTSAKVELNDSLSVFELYSRMDEFNMSIDEKGDVKELKDAPSLEYDAVSIFSKSRSSNNYKAKNIYEPTSSPQTKERDTSDAKTVRVRERVFVNQEELLKNKFKDLYEDQMRQIASEKEAIKGRERKETEELSREELLKGIFLHEKNQRRKRSLNLISVFLIPLFTSVLTIAMTVLFFGDDSDSEKQKQESYTKSDLEELKKQLESNRKYDDRAIRYNRRDVDSPAAYFELIKKTQVALEEIEAELEVVDLISNVVITEKISSLKKEIASAQKDFIFSKDKLKWWAQEKLDWVDKQEKLVFLDTDENSLRRLGADLSLSDDNIKKIYEKYIQSYRQYKEAIEIYNGPSLNYKTEQDIENSKHQLKVISDSLMRNIRKVVNHNIDVIEENMRRWALDVYDFSVKVRALETKLRFLKKKQNDINQFNSHITAEELIKQKNRNELLLEKYIKLIGRDYYGRLKVYQAIEEYAY